MHGTRKRVTKQPKEEELSDDSQDSTEIKEECIDEVNTTTSKPGLLGVPYGHPGFSPVLIGKDGKKRKADCGHVIAVADPHSTCPKCRDRDAVPVCSQTSRCPQCLDCDNTVYWTALSANVRKQRNKAHEDQRQRLARYEQTGVICDMTYTSYQQMNNNEGETDWTPVFIRLPYHGPGYGLPTRRPLPSPVRPLGTAPDDTSLEQDQAVSGSAITISSSSAVIEKDPPTMKLRKNTDKREMAIAPEMLQHELFPKTAMSRANSIVPKASTSTTAPTATKTYKGTLRRSSRHMKCTIESVPDITNTMTDETTAEKSHTTRTVVCRRTLHPHGKTFEEDIKWFARVLCASETSITMTVAMPPGFNNPNKLDTILPDLRILYDQPSTTSVSESAEQCAADDTQVMEPECDFDASVTGITHLNVTKIENVSPPRPDSREQCARQNDVNSVVVAQAECQGDALSDTDARGSVSDELYAMRLRNIISDFDYACGPMYTLHRSLPALGRVPVFRREWRVCLPNVLEDLCVPILPDIENSDEFPFQLVLERIKADRLSVTGVDILHTTVTSARPPRADNRNRPVGRRDYYGIATCPRVLECLEQLVFASSSGVTSRRYCRLMHVPSLSINNVPYRAIDSSISLQAARWPRQPPLWMPNVLYHNLDVPVTDLTMRKFEARGRLALRVLSMQDVLVEALQTISRVSGDSAKYDIYLHAMGRVTEDLTKIITEWLWNVVQLRRDAILQASTCDVEQARWLRDAPLTFGTDLFPGV